MSKKKWNGVLITEHNVDQYLSDLASTKARHITQGVSFNKLDSQQMNLLRLALIRHNSFSGLVKFLLAEYFKEEPIDWDIHPLSEEVVKTKIHQQEYKKKVAKQVREKKVEEKAKVTKAKTVDIDKEKTVETPKPKPAGKFKPPRKNARGNFGAILVTNNGTEEEDE